MTDEPIEGEVVPDDIPTPGAESTSVALAPRQRRSEVIRPLNADDLIESFDAYQSLLPRLLSPSDYQSAGKDKDGNERRFVKKSGWRKIATAFDLDVQILRSVVERDEAGQPQRAEVWARAVAPSGRSMDGDGYCSVDEERFGRAGDSDWKLAKARAKLENDLRATATTRAMNRAISGLVGMGEVSAEEVDGAGEHAPAAAHLIGQNDVADLVEALKALTGAGADDKPAIQNLWKYIRGEHERPTVAVATAILAVHAQRAAFAERNPVEPTA